MVSIVLPVHNDKEYIGAAVEAILGQSVRDFELIIVDDASDDATKEALARFHDPRIRILTSTKQQGIAASRDAGVRAASGELLFFTDSDCVVDRDWLRQGVDAFATPDTAAVEGLTYYIDANYTPSLADKLPGTTKTPSQYMTCNMAYRTFIFREPGMLDPALVHHSDRDLAFQILKSHTIAFASNMIVTHQKKLWNPAGFVRSGGWASNRVLLFKKHGDRYGMWGRVLYPKNLLKLLFFPLAYVGPLSKGLVRSRDDLRLLPLVYPRLVYERYSIWRSALRERVFVL